MNQRIDSSVPSGDPSVHHARKRLLCKAWRKRRTIKFQVHWLNFRVIRVSRIRNPSIGLIDQAWVLLE